MIFPDNTFHSYDEKIVFSGDYKQYFINFLRALDSDQDVILIGEKGVGKRSLARYLTTMLFFFFSTLTYCRFSTLFMGLELITMDAEDSDWKEIFRQALLDASRFELHITWLEKNLFFILRDVADMIIVLDPEYVEKNEVLATISDIRAYGFRSLLPGFKDTVLHCLLICSWNLITDYERKELLYADHDDPFMSLFSKEKFDEMDQFLVAKVRTNHVLVMSNHPRLAF